MPGNKLIFALPVLITLAIGGGRSAGDHHATPTASATSAAPAPASLPPEPAALAPVPAFPTYEEPPMRPARPTRAICRHAGVVGLGAIIDDLPTWEAGEPAWHQQARRSQGPCARPAPGSLHGSI